MTRPRADGFGAPNFIMQTCMDEFGAPNFIA